MHTKTPFSGLTVKRSLLVTKRVPGGSPLRNHSLKERYGDQLNGPRHV
ncbi:hypothetical protein [Lactiplantibacillus garii]|nr:hypothetical protein [Lactiplantibacillus garii]